VCEEGAADEFGVDCRDASRFKNIGGRSLCDLIGDDDDEAPAEEETPAPAPTPPPTPSGPGVGEEGGACYASVDALQGNIYGKENGITFYNTLTQTWYKYVVPIATNNLDGVKINGNQGKTVNLAKYGEQIVQMQFGPTSGGPESLSNNPFEYPQDDMTWTCGAYSGMEGDKLDFTQGSSSGCNGPRQTTLTLTCGKDEDYPEGQITALTEPSQCNYEMTLAIQDCCK
jgi:hypothetical protein